MHTELSVGESEMKQQASRSGRSTIISQKMLSTLGVLVIALLSLTYIPLSEGGCSRFGHSCFGAHGKRAEVPLSVSGEESEPLGSFGPINTPLDFYPPNGLRMSPYFKEWIISTHRDRSEGLNARDPSKDLIRGDMQKK